MVFRIASIVGVVASFVLFASGPVMAQSLFERLVNPGELTKGHAKFQKTCKSCHKSFSKGAQSSLCIDCHRDVGMDKERKSGFHGKGREVAKVECSYCHKDHKGREASITQFDPETFDHNLSDFPMKEAHVEVACANCHVQDKKYREASRSCVDCHEKIDRHKGELGTQCANCHSEKNWHEVKKFDHGKTKFPLKGAHQKATCDQCHGNRPYKEAVTQCVACHKADDVHKTQLGEDCKACHQETAWAQGVFFDHDISSFPLIGLHAAVPCGECHLTAAFKETSSSCHNCHKSKDHHKGRLGVNCGDCHNPNGWKRWKFNHDRQTKFRLTGRHAGLDCQACHRKKNVKKVKASTSCYSCHKKQDVHNGAYGRNCGKCHTTKNFTTAYIKK